MEDFVKHFLKKFLKGCLKEFWRWNFLLNSLEERFRIRFVEEFFNNFGIHSQKKPWWNTWTFFYRNFWYNPYRNFFRSLWNLFFTESGGIPERIIAGIIWSISRSNLRRLSWRNYWMTFWWNPWMTSWKSSCGIVWRNPWRNADGISGETPSIIPGWSPENISFRTLG